MVSDVNLHPYSAVSYYEFLPLCFELLVERAKVGRCKLDPGLKAKCFQPLNLRVRSLLSI